MGTKQFTIDERRKESAYILREFFSVRDVFGVSRSFKTSTIKIMDIRLQFSFFYVDVILYSLCCRPFNNVDLGCSLCLCRPLFWDFLGSLLPSLAQAVHANTRSLALLSNVLANSRESSWPSHSVLSSLLSPATLPARRDLRGLWFHDVTLAKARSLEQVWRDSQEPFLEAFLCKHTNTKLTEEKNFRVRIFIPRDLHALQYV